MYTEKRIVVVVNKVLEKRNISLRELSRLSDIDISQLSPLVNNKRQRIDIGHIQRIAEALDLEDMNEIITIEAIEYD